MIQQVEIRGSELHKADFRVYHRKLSRSKELLVREAWAMMPRDTLCLNSDGAMSDRGHRRSTNKNLSSETVESRLLSSQVSAFRIVSSRHSYVLACGGVETSSIRFTKIS